MNELNAKRKIDQRTGDKLLSCMINFDDCTFKTMFSLSVIALFPQYGPTLLNLTTKVTYNLSRMSMCFFYFICFYIYKGNLRLHYECI